MLVRHTLFYFSIIQTVKWTDIDIISILSTTYQLHTINPFIYQIY